MHAPPVPRARDLQDGWLRVRWSDDRERSFTVSTQLDGAWLDDPHARRLDPDCPSLAAAAARTLDAWAASRGLQVQTRPAPGSALAVDVHGPEGLVDRYGAELPGALREARDQAFIAAGYRRSAAGALTVDLPRLARQSAPRLKPLALALLGTVPSRDYATFAARCLSFVQAIPYRSELRRFTLPAGVLAEDHGDCDEKCLLVLGLLKAAFPDTRALVVYPPMHALLGLPLAAGPHRIQAHSRGWALCEPCGPAQLPPGHAGEDTLAALSQAPPPVALVA